VPPRPPRPCPLQNHPAAHGHGLRPVRRSQLLQPAAAQLHGPASAISDAQASSTTLAQVSYAWACCSCPWAICWSAAAWF
jgi:hypothetical protein